MSKTVVNKVTKVVWDNGFKPDGVNIPSVTSADQGKVLAVDSNGKWVAASPSAPQSELPVYTAADEGKILKVDDQGALEWAEDDNTEYTAGDNVSIVNGEISAVDTTYTAGDNIEISADNEISSVNTVVFDVKYMRATDTFQYDDTAVEPFLTEVFKNDKRAIVRVQDGNYNIFDIYTLRSYESTNKRAAFSKVNPSIVSANHREIVCSNIALSVVQGVGTLTYTNEGVRDLPENATAGQIAISDGNNGWVAGNIPTELPSVTSVDEGKVLKVDANGDWAVGTDNDTTYTAGTNVQINGGVISATDTTYTAGANISINAQNEISATDTTYSEATTTDAGLMSAADKVKLNGIETGAEVNVNADWNAASGDAQILNKPNLATVATSGDYTDLINKPTIPSYSAGANVQINDGVISATDTTYTAGTNVQINNGVISATDTVYTLPTADASTLGGVKVGTNLSIDSNGVLSATDTTYSAGNGITITGTTIAADAQLPAVTSIDEGKVLKVDNTGAWAVGSDDNTTYSAGTNISIDANNQISAVDTTYSAGTGISIDGSNVISADSQLPSVTSSDEGNVLTVDSLGNWVPDAVPKELPAVTSSDEGQVLTVDSNGQWVKATPSGGGILIPNRDNVIKATTAMTNSNTYYTATQDCYVYCKLVGISGTSASSGLDYMIVIYPAGDSVHGYATVAEGRYTIGTGNPVVSHGFYLKSGYTIQIQQSIASFSGLTGNYTVYGLI